MRIREVLSNLVANALRHTPSGGRVTVAGAVEDGELGPCSTVRDTGPGIDPALLPHVFDRFVKGDESRGSGLGLAIARQLVVAHGGEIAVDVAAGRGNDDPGPAARLRAGDPDVVDGGLDRARPAEVGGREDDADRLARPTVSSGLVTVVQPGQVRVRGTELLLDERPDAVRVLDVRPEVVSRRRVRSCGRGSSGT